MKAFCLNDVEMDCAGISAQGNVSGTFGNRVTDECLISLKVYDFCRQQDCLDSDLIGPARAAKDCNICGTHFDEGEIIKPPSDAAAVSIEKLRVKKVVVVSKEPNPFKKGFWDIDLKYVFTYLIVFRGVDGEELCTARAKSVFNKKVTLFGSTATDILLSTDLFCSNGNSSDLDADPFVLVESKAIALDAKLVYPSVAGCGCNRGCDCNCGCGCGGCGGCGCDDNGVDDAIEVRVTIGLFTIIKLFRLVQLVVESKGFCIPPKCNESESLEPCDFFASLDFPMDIFAPPQKREFLAGVSSNIPAETSRDCDCGNKNNNCNNNCGCGCNSGCGCGC